MPNPPDAGLLETILERKRVFDGLIVSVDHATAKLPNGRLARREIAVHVGASAVVPVDDAGNVYLVRQFRAPVGKVLLEIPAGKLDGPDEDRLLAAKRELEEETGFEAARWTHLSDIVTTPGFCDERISLYLAQDLASGDARPDEDEFLNLVKMPLEDACRAALSGEIGDAKTVCAVLLARERIRSEACRI
ncbi:MAG: NUDIX hydrolase [Clostridiales bacterium]|nr:NUDIX hydrolase [Clostridiales bacterium]